MYGWVRVYCLDNAGCGSNSCPRDRESCYWHITLILDHAIIGSPRFKIPLLICNKILVKNVTNFCILEIRCTVGAAAYNGIQWLKGSVQQKLRPRLLYIIQKLFSWRWAAENKFFTFLKGQFTIYIKPLQWSCPSPITFAGKCYSPSANCVCGQ